MTRRDKQLATAAAAIAIVAGLTAGVPVSALLLIGFVAAMVLILAGDHGRHGGCGGGFGHSAHRHSSDTDGPHAHDDTARR